MHYKGDGMDKLSTMELRVKVNSYGFGRDFTSWVRRELMKIKIELHGLGKDDREHELTLALNAFLSRLKDDNPPDARYAAEQRLGRMRFDRDLVEMTHDVLSLPPGNFDAAASLEDAVERLVRRAEREFPAFRDDHEGVLRGFSNALRTHRTEGGKGRFAGPSSQPERPKRPLRTST
jgi:hypothetical protein